MKNKVIDLNLFGEGAECAAEQSAVEGGTDAAVCMTESSEGTAQGASEKSEREMSDVVGRIAELLSIDGGDEESLVKAVNARRARAALSEMLRRRRAERTYSALIGEACELSSKVKGFDLRAELSDKRFAAMLHAGLSVEEAWRAIHFEELLSASRRNAEKAAMANALEKIRSTTARPEENGTAGGAPQDSRTSVESLTGRGIRDILRRVENGAKIKF